MTIYELFERIKAQQQARGQKLSLMSQTEREIYASECVLALHVEVSELASSWAFARWKNTEPDIDNIKREVVDCLFFLVNICSMFNISSGDIVLKFDWVLANNYERIRNGQHRPIGG